MGSERNERHKIYYVRGDLASHCLSRLCLRPNVQVVLSVKAEWLSGPDGPGGRADGDPRRRGTLKSL